jgi:hypothetical protein
VQDFLLARNRQREQRGVDQDDPPEDQRVVLAERR